MSELRETSFSKSPAPIREGYVFGVWYTDEALTKAYDFSEKVTDSFVLYAKWDESITYTNPFDDITEDDRYYEDVKFVNEKGFMIGTDEKEFSPEEIVNRAMLVTLLWRLEESPLVESSVEFEDVLEGEWYTEAVDWASANGIVNGYGNGMFEDIESDISDLTEGTERAELAAYLRRFCKKFIVYFAYSFFFSHSFLQLALSSSVKQACHLLRWRRQ